MKLTIELDREVDGRWIAEVPELNVLLYGDSKQDAIQRAQSAAREIVLDRIAHGELPPDSATPNSILPHEFLAFGQSASCVRRPKRIGWRHDRTVGSHKIMKKDGWADYPFSFHDSDELGPAILARVSKKTGLQPEDP
jgi:predicted RNA binding protein YcfA (HicA-like mRNA interferase family)/predicted RNase H-like HicB family nuclease